MQNIIFKRHLDSSLITIILRLLIILTDDPTDHFGIVDALGKDEQASSRSDVPVQTWGLVQRLHKQGRVI